MSDAPWVIVTREQDLAITEHLKKKSKRLLKANIAELLHREEYSKRDLSLVILFLEANRK